VRGGRCENCGTCIDDMLRGRIPPEDDPGFRPSGFGSSDEPPEMTLEDDAHDEPGFPDEEDLADPGDMDGDHDSCMASCGWGTDEDYGYDGDDGFDYGEF